MGKEWRWRSAEISPKDDDASADLTSFLGKCNALNVYL